MKRLLPIAIISLLIATRAEAAPPQGQERQCWLDAMSDAQKRELVLGYARIQRTEGKARADIWAQEQKTAYDKKFVAVGICPSSRAARARDSAPAGEPHQEEKILNRYGKPCKRIELENQNVPNIGGAMGWALIPVCKD